jgi:hypothetical protein
VHRSVHDGLDDDRLVFQDRPLRLTIAVPFVGDDIQISEAAEIFTDGSFITIETICEVANGLDSVAVLVEILDKFETALCQDLAAVLPAQYEDVSVPFGVEVTRELVLLAEPIGDMLIRGLARIRIGTGHTVAYNLNGIKKTGRT